MGNFIPIGEEEKDLLITLHDMVFLDMEYVQKFIYPAKSKQVVLRKVRNLEKEKYIKSFYTPKVDETGAKNIKIITLDKFGVEEVAALTGEINWSNRWTKRSPAYIHHVLSLANIRAACYAGKSSGFDLVSWVPERSSYFQYSSRKEEVIIPDGTMIFKRTVNDNSAYFAYFVEMERSRQRISVSQNKLRRYNDYVGHKAQQKHSIFPITPIGLMVTFISANENEMLNLIEHTKNVTTNNLTNVLYSTYQDVIENPYGDIWRCKGRGEDKYPLRKIFKT